MEFEEFTAENIGVVIQEIGRECSFVNTVGKGNHDYSNIHHEIEAYEDAFSEINIERERFLLCEDEMVEEMLGN